MSQEDLWKALGRSQLDLGFSAQVRTDPEQTVHRAGYLLDPGELNQLRQLLSAPIPDSNAGPELPIQSPFPGGPRFLPP